MAFVVLSPGLTADGQRGQIPPSTRKALDELLGTQDRRPRRSGAIVWRIATLGPSPRTQLQAALTAFSDEHRVDTALLESPLRWRDFVVLAMDMDSTVITIECIDEIADFCGKKQEVAAITEAAMRGEIKDYAESLRQRVALLAGLSATALEEVIRYRLKFTPGVKALVATARQHHVHALLVSGGFTQFTGFVAEKIGFDQTRSNTLEIIDGHLTGRLLGNIVDARIKQTTLAQACRSRGVTMQQSIAIGDGANDLKMMKGSGLSVAHRAKPAVAAQAMQAIRHGGLDNILDWFE
jgi:phosphoserine phosphatase